jgi:DnaJ-class molecular chaperone
MSVSLAACVPHRRTRGVTLAKRLRGRELAPCFGRRRPYPLRQDVSGRARDFYELSTVPRGTVLTSARTLGEVELDELEAAWGTSRSVLVGREEPCALCAGSRFAPGHAVAVCGTCAGRGTVHVSGVRRGRWLRVDPCESCGGDGRVRPPCAACDGKGTTVRERTITVRIAPGVEDGARLHLVGEPEEAQLLVRVLPRPHGSRLVRYAAAMLCALALAFLVFLLQLG